MKVLAFTQTVLAPIVVYPVKTIAFAPAPRISPHRTTLYSKDVMSDIDIMCISNAANLCSHYDQCDVEEREAMLNRFEEQTDLLAERMATLQSITKHLKNGDHLEANDNEIATLKNKIMASVGHSEVEFLDETEVRQLQIEINAALKNKDVVPVESILMKWCV